MKKLALRFYLFVCLPIVPAALQGVCSTALEEGQFSLGYASAEWISLDQSYGEAGVFFPFATSEKWATFADLTTYRFSEGKWGGSFGMAFRSNCINDQIIGANLYFDMRQGKYGMYRQMGMGLERLGDDFDVRFNSYLPLSIFERGGHKNVYRDYQGDYGAECRLTQVTTRAGFDLELGAPTLCHREVKIYTAGGIYFYDWECKDNFWGGMARMVFTWDEFFRVEARGSYDKTNHMRGQVVGYVDVPLEALWNCKLFAREPSTFFQRVHRTGTIFLEDAIRYDWNWPTREKS